MEWSLGAVNVPTPKTSVLGPSVPGSSLKETTKFADTDDLVTAEWPDSSKRRTISSTAKKIARPFKKPTVAGSSSTNTPDDLKRKSKVAELLALAKERSDAEQLEEEALDTENSDEAPVLQSTETPVSEKENQKNEKRARRRAKKQQKLIRDITFREKKSLGKLPANLIQQAPISCIASVPVFLLVLVLAVASNMESIPKPVQEILRVDADSLPRLPPPGLGIVDLSSSIITLDSGHRALEIRGELLNATTNRFQNIQLLASLFNESNQKTRSMVVNPVNELKSAQVVALDAEAIARLQSRHTASGAEFAPNERLPFRIVFPGYTGSEKWFSTSVYSVESEFRNI